jgi:hypothetical protein
MSLGVEAALAQPLPQPAAPSPAEVPPPSRAAASEAPPSAIFDPELVPASQADLPSDEWILGVEIGGDARAYDLNLLNEHAVVNDTVGGVPIAAVSCPQANGGFAYHRRMGERVLRLEASGALLHGTIVLRDLETKSSWSLLAARAIGGELEGTPLVELSGSRKATWKEWYAQHPSTKVWSVEGRTFGEKKPSAESFLSAIPEGEGVELDDDRLSPAEPIFAFRASGASFAVTHRNIEGGLTLSTEPDDGVGDTRVFLLRTAQSPPLESTRAYRFPKEWLIGFFVTPRVILDRIEGAIAAGRAEEEGVEIVHGFDTLWYAWADQNSDTRILP